MEEYTMTEDMTQSAWHTMTLQDRGRSISLHGGGLWPRRSLLCVYTASGVARRNTMSTTGNSVRRGPNGRTLLASICDRQTFFCKNKESENHTALSEFGISK